MNVPTLTLSTVLDSSHQLICVQLCSTFMDSLHNPETRNTSRRKHTRNWKYSKSEYVRVQHSLTDPFSRHRRRHLLPTRRAHVHRRLKRIIKPRLYWKPASMPIISTRVRSPSTATILVSPAISPVRCLTHERHERVRGVRDDAGEVGGSPTQR